MAALEGAGDSCEAVLGDFVTSPGWVPGLDSLGARGRNQRGDPGSARVAASPWDVTAYIVARCQELGMSLPGEMTGSFGGDLWCAKMGVELA